jgi:hypothetical protein
MATPLIFWDKYNHENQPASSVIALKGRVNLIALTPFKLPG